MELGLILLAQDKWADAEATFRQVLAVREKRVTDPKPEVASWQVADTQSQVGAALLGQKRYADAEPLLRAAYQGLTADPKAVPAAGKQRLTQTVERLAALYTRWGKSDEGARWRAERAKYPPELAPRPRPSV